MLTFYASHDDALTALRGHTASLPGGFRACLDIRFVGSVDAIQALNEGRCIMAGFHTRRAPPRARWPSAPTSPCCGRASTRSSAYFTAPRA